MAGGAARRVGKVGSAVLPAVWPARDPSVLVVTALHNQPCAYPRGDHLNFLSIMNKQVRAAGAAHGVEHFSWRAAAYASFFSGMQ